MQCTAIILRSDPFKESDRIVTLFSREYGVLRLIAKGSQKITSKNAIALEPATISIIGIAEGKELSYITSAQADVQMTHIRTDMLKSVAALYILHLVSRTLKEHDPHEVLWEDLAAWLHMLNSEVPFQLRIVNAFVLRMMAAIGFAPDLGDTQNAVAFSISDGGLVDKDTARLRITERQQVIKVDTDVVLTLQTWLTVPWNTLLEPVIELQTSVALHRIVYEYTKYHLERDIADWEKMIYSYD